MEKSEIISVLEQCFDPEIPIDLWNLGLIYDIHAKPIDGTELHDVLVIMSLTTPGCHMGQHMANDVKTKLEALDTINKATVSIIFDPPWTPDMMSNVAREKLGLAAVNNSGENQSFDWE
ncbi:MAG: metal-sulfur cluster assembly factor [Candidatus Marinimicrobia bacterium]|nr:metal-sulfur cluster assembly factor [Candidatus Neomarinimicrobiota bacterium]